MAKNNLLRFFVKNTISDSESKALKGGRNNSTIPIDNGSYGFINWDDIDVREPELTATVGQSISIIRKFRKGG